MGHHCPHVPIAARLVRRGRGASRRRSWSERPQTLAGRGEDPLSGPRKRPNQEGWRLLLHRCARWVSESRSPAPPAGAGQTHACSASTTLSGTLAHASTAPESTRIGQERDAAPDERTERRRTCQP